MASKEGGGEEEEISFSFLSYRVRMTSLIFIVCQKKDIKIRKTKKSFSNFCFKQSLISDIQYVDT